MFSLIEGFCLGFASVCFAFALISKKHLKRSGIKSVKVLSLVIPLVLVATGLFLVFMGIKAGLSSLIEQIDIKHLFQLCVYQIITVVALVLAWRVFDLRKLKVKVKFLKKSKKEKEPGGGAA